MLTAVVPTEYRGFAARTGHAAGLAALAQGNYVTAYAQLSRLFATDGTPLHHQFSYLAVAVLAAAAARAQRRLEAGMLLERALAAMGPRPRAAAGTTDSPRRRTARRVRPRRRVLRRAPGRPCWRAWPLHSSARSSSSPVAA